MIDTTLAALADPTRRAVVDALRRGPRRAGELAEEARTSPPAMSRHLRILRRAGVVTEESPPEDARVKLYRLESGPLVELDGWLREVTAAWEGQLTAFAAWAERGDR